MTTLPTRKQLLEDILIAAQNVIDGAMYIDDVEGIPNDIKAIPEDVYHKLDFKLREYEAYEEVYEVDLDAPVEANPNEKPYCITGITTEECWGLRNIRAAGKAYPFLDDETMVGDLDVEFKRDHYLRVSGAELSVILTAQTVRQAAELSEFVRLIEGGAVIKYDALTNGCTPYTESFC